LNAVNLILSIEVVDNMYQDKVQIVQATPYVYEKYYRDYRLVVVKWYLPDGRVDQYSRHWQTADDGALLQGFYCKTEREAAAVIRSEMAAKPAVWGGKYLRKVNNKPMLV